MVKIPTIWSINPGSLITDIYDPTTTTYDTIYTHYDGNQDTTQSPVGNKVATVWSAA